MKQGGTASIRPWWLYLMTAGDFYFAIVSGWKERFP